MNENKSLPTFNSTEELVEFFDSTDTGDFDLPEVGFEVNLQTREFLVPVDEALMLKIIRSAQKRGISTQDLVRGWLEEKVAT